MSPDDIKRDREMHDNLQRLASMKREEETRNLWHAFGYLVPFAATILGLCFLGICVFVALRVMSESWNAMNWAW